MDVEMSHFISQMLTLQYICIISFNENLMVFKTFSVDFHVIVLKLDHLFTYPLVCDNSTRFITLKTKVLNYFINSKL